MALRKKIEIVNPNRPGLTGARDKLLAAAIELMREQDVVDVSIRDVAERANLNSSLIRYYFGSKDGLRLAAYEFYAGPSMVRHLANIRSSRSPETKLAEFIDEIIRCSEEFPSGQRLVLELLRDANPKHSKRIFTEFTNQLIDYLEIILKEGGREGIFLTADARDLFFIIVGACQCPFSSNTIMNFVYREKLSSNSFRQHYGRQILTTIMDGLRQPAR